MNHIPAAARAVLSALPWILVAGALKGLTQNQDSRSVQVAAVILCFVCIVIAYGVIVARMMPGRTTNPLRILKDHFLHCAVIGIAIGLPVAAVTVAMMPMYMFTGQLVPLMLMFLPAVVSALTMFVLPIAIIEGAGVSAIGRGLRVVGTMPRTSAVLGGVIVMGHAVHFAGTVMATRVPPDLVRALFVSVEMVVAIILFGAFAGAVAVIPGRESGG